ncbi:hypothetical protein C8T65DRAFT_6961 [Cerioporus squamosus]|nr:hypothetical protein C8T65DRAFT_6961 [Cerioporus squamosus]
MSGSDQYPQTTNDQASWQSDQQFPNQDRTQGQRGMQAGDHFDPSGGQQLRDDGPTLPPRSGERDLPFNASEQQPGSQGGYGKTGFDFQNEPGEQGGYTESGIGGARSGDPSDWVPQSGHHLEQDSPSYGDSAAPPAGGRTNRSTASSAQKVIGQVEKATGKMTGNPGMVARGETRKMGHASGMGNDDSPPYQED